ncbi:MAG: putative FmdB family regulatory protein [Paraglaciecola sp.]|jgi:putative FmdB family regulatory protein
MPLYDYQCESCGTFSALRKMSESANPSECDSCGEMAARIISAPHLALLSSSTRIAHERNEKASHEPRQTRRSSCGCSTDAHSCKPASKQNANPTTEGHGLLMQTKKTARPWMLGH